MGFGSTSIFFKFCIVQSECIYENLDISLLEDKVVVVDSLRTCSFPVCWARTSRTRSNHRVCEHPSWLVASSYPRIARLVLTEDIIHTHIYVYTCVRWSRVDYIYIFIYKRTWTHTDVWMYKNENIIEGVREKEGKGEENLLVSLSLWTSLCRKRTKLRPTPCAQVRRVRGVGELDAAHTRSNFAKTSPRYATTLRYDQSTKIIHELVNNEHKRSLRRNWKNNTSQIIFHLNWRNYSSK